MLTTFETCVQFERGTFHITVCLHSSDRSNSNTNYHFRIANKLSTNGQNVIFSRPIGDKENNNNFCIYSIAENLMFCFFVFCFYVMYIWLERPET